MNTRPLDLWTLTHITSGFLVTTFLMSVGADFFSILFTVFFIAFIYEILEHMVLFNLVKEAKEVPINSFLDIVFGLVGMGLAWMF